MRGELWHKRELGESRCMNGVTSSREPARCQAMALRSWDTPLCAGGRFICRVKNTR